MCLEVTMQSLTLFQLYRDAFDFVTNLYRHVQNGNFTRIDIFGFRLGSFLVIFRNFSVSATKVFAGGRLVSLASRAFVMSQCVVQILLLLIYISADLYTAERFLLKSHGTGAFLSLF